MYEPDLKLLPHDNPACMLRFVTSVPHGEQGTSNIQLSTIAKLIKKDHSS